MKILYIIDDISVMGGIQKILKIKIDYFIENLGYKIDIVTESYKNSNLFFEQNKKVKIYNLDFEREVSFWKRQIQKIKSFKFLNKLQNKEKYDFIITTGSNLDLLLPLLRKKTTIFKEIHYSGTELFNNKKNLFSKISNIYYKISYSMYNQIILLTEEDKQFWDKLKVENTIIIPNMLESNDNKISECNNKIAISVGRLAEQKRFDLLVDVWSKVNKINREWKLYIYGEGPERKNLESQIKKLNLQDFVFLKGASLELNEKYLEASLFILTSRMEGMPMVLLESMIKGVPVVSFDCPCGPKDIITNGKDGYIVEFGNINIMAEKILDLINDEKKRKEFGKEAKRNMGRFSKEKIIKKWKELFEIYKN